MILNTYALLLGFIGLIRLLSGLLVLGLGAATWSWTRPAPAPDARQLLENRGYFVFLVTLLLVVLNLASWPMLYLLLQSYVSEWPGVMCIYGVTQIGAGSLGPSRFLTNLLSLLQLSKPALAFLGGAWFVIYLINRQTRTAPLLPRLFRLLFPLGLLAVVDSLAELAYIAIPKKEEFPTGGCCTVAFEQGAAARFLPAALLGGLSESWLTPAFYLTNFALIVGLVGVTWRADRAVPRSLIMVPILCWAVVVAGVSGVFLVDVAAPKLLQLPYHHCPYDLIPQVPEAIAAVTLYLAGCFFLGWGAVARWGGWCTETQQLVASTVHRLFRLSLLSYLAALVMMTLEMALA
jgi:hypothetical protein